ncbi:MAG: hypothetical protein LBQ44_07255 [Treponema sp.]|jgi:hypothetical protein|nr:hypothetical protein [Treponema sp.]
MVKKQIFLPGLLLLALIFTSCDSFFSDSWGQMRDYDPSKIDLNAGNLDSWIESSIGNPKLAAALAEKIKATVKNSADSKERAKFQEAGVTLAVEASGIGASILSNAGAALGDIEDLQEEAVMDILKKIQDDFKSGGPQAAASLAEIVSVPGTLTGNTQGGTPEFEGNYAGTAKAGDVGQAVLVLALAVFGETGDVEAEIDKLTESGNPAVAGLQIDSVSGRIKIADADPAPEAVALAAYLNLIAEDNTGRFADNPITDALKKAFSL